MDQERYELIPIGIDLQGRWVLPDVSKQALEEGLLDLPAKAFRAEGEPVTLILDPARRELVSAAASGSLSVRLDVAFPVLHGPFGEDGTAQGLLDMAGVPYVGSGVLGSAIGMDKEKMKVVFGAAGLPVAGYIVIGAGQWAQEKERMLDEAAWLGFPSFTKPANMGSSVGVSRCTNLASLEAGIETAFLHDRKVIVERGIDGREIECAVLGNEDPQASVCGEILSSGEFYDYEAKYIDSGSQTIVPAPIPEPVAETIRRYSVRAFKAIEGAGMARVDFFYQEGGLGVVVNEINTIPGFTTISMFPKLWEASGLSYPALLDRLIELALERHSFRSGQSPPGSASHREL